MNQLKPFVATIICLLALLLSVEHVSAATQSFYLKRWVFDAAGGLTTSTGYRNLSVTGQSSPLGAAASSGYRNYPGFLHSVAAEGNLLPDYTVSLSFAGSGSGRVTSFPVGIQCNLDCSAPFNSYFPVTLTPTADQYMIFSGWSGGGCSGSAPCTITLTGNTTVNATFDNDTAHMVYVPGTVPGTGTYYTTLQAAYDGADPGSTVSAWAISYLENLTCGMDKSILLKGGYDQNYTSQTGYTILDGVLTIGRGVLTVDRLIVK